MDNKMIMFDSMTQAIRAREILRKNGIMARVKKTPPSRGRSSCGYALILNRDFLRAVKLIKDSSMEFTGIFPDDEP